MSWHGHWARWGRGVQLAALLSAGGAHGPVAAQAPAGGRPPSELAACAASQKQAYAELAQQHETELRRHAMHPVLVARLKGLGGGLSALRAATARAPRNPAECEKNTQALVDAREQLERIVGSPTQLSDCVAANRLAYGEMQASLLGLQTAGAAVTPALEAAAGRLDRLRGPVAREDLALADCRQLGTDLADVRTQVQRLLPTPAPQRTAAAAPTAPGQGACREAQARSYNEVAQAYARVVGAPAIPVEWMAPLQAMSERLRKLHAAIADPARPGWDCEAVAQALAKERGELAALSRR